MEALRARLRGRYARAVIVVGFVLSALLEIGGLVMILGDIALDRDAVRRLSTRPPSEPVTLDQSNIRRFPGPLSLRKRLLQIESDSTADTDEVRAALIDRLHSDWKRLIGPGLIFLGIVVGTIANIAAL